MHSRTSTTRASSLIYHLVVLASLLCLYPLQVVERVLQGFLLDLLRLENDSLLLVLKLESVVPDDQSSVLLGSQFTISPDSHLFLLLISLELLYSPFHLSETQVELFDLVSVSLLALFAVS